MALNNTKSRYGAVAKTFHWLTALLILSVLPLGLIAENLAQAVRAAGAGAEDALIARTVLAFSLHKTLGVMVFFVAVLRILWAIIQPKPELLNGDHRLEAWAAETVHWLLYGSLVLVPLSGWIHHAASTGFAPIWWPFGQSLPFVPKSESLSELASTLHFLLVWVLAGALGAHIAGALKHHVIDGDATLRRMLPGKTEASGPSTQPGHFLSLLSALVVWAAVLGGAATLGWFAPHDHRAAATPAETTAPATGGNWQVENGSLAITVLQMGSDVSGQFTDWTATILYDDTPDANGRHGSVAVEIAIASLTLGSVTDQALGADYLDVTTYPVAQVQADLVSHEDHQVAIGTLTIRGQSMPIEMPFALQIDGDTAQASGTLRVDRRDFGVGASTVDESSLGFGVDVRFELTATRAN